MTDAPAETPKKSLLPIHPLVKEYSAIPSMLWASWQIITVIVIPYHQALLLIPHVGIVAWYFYSWRKNRVFLVSWLAQCSTVQNAIICSVCACLSITLGGSYHISIGAVWIGIASCWIALMHVTGYERDKFYDNILLAHANQLSRLNDMVALLLSDIRTVSETQSLMVEREKTKRKLEELEAREVARQIDKDGHVLEAPRIIEAVDLS